MVAKVPHAVWAQLIIGGAVLLLGAANLLFGLLELGSPDFGAAAANDYDPAAPPASFAYRVGFLAAHAVAVLAGAILIRRGSRRLLGATTPSLRS
jgi:hypothetical protein